MLLKSVFVVFFVISICVSNVCGWFAGTTNIKLNPYATPCSSDLSKAWLDLILVVDVSSNMGQNNLRRIGLSISSEIQNFTFTTGNSDYTSRVALITYSSYYTVVGYLNTYNGTTQLTKDLLNLTASADNSSAGLCSEAECAGGAMKKINDWINSNWDSYSGNGYGANRATVVVFFMASLNGISQSDVFQQGYSRPYVNQVKFITINYNPSDAQLTNFLQQPRDGFYYLQSDSTNLYKNLNKYLIQANCFIFSAAWQYQLADNQTSTIYADSFQVVSTFDGTYDSPNDFCIQTTGAEYNLMTAVAITSEFKANFVESILAGGSKLDYAIGLHRNAQGKWMWYDYDGSEFPLGNFTRWAPGYNENSAGNCVVARYYPGKPYHLWETTQCQMQGENIADMVACQFHACDASFTVYECSVNGMA